MQELRRITQAFTSVQLLSVMIVTVKFLSQPLLYLILFLLVASVQ